MLNYRVTNVKLVVFGKFIEILSSHHFEMLLVNLRSFELKYYFGDLIKICILFIYQVAPLI